MSQLSRKSPLGNDGEKIKKHELIAPPSDVVEITHVIAHVTPENRSREMVVQLIAADETETVTFSAAGRFEPRKDSIMVNALIADVCRQMARVHPFYREPKYDNGAKDEKDFVDDLSGMYITAYANDIRRMVDNLTDSSHATHAASTPLIPTALIWKTRYDDINRPQGGAVDIARRHSGQKLQAKKLEELAQVISPLGQRKSVFERMKEKK